ncbi:hypothetical protein ACLOJK_002325 [Asimina triloba]
MVEHWAPRHKIKACKPRPAPLSLRPFESEGAAAVEILKIESEGESQSRWEKGTARQCMAGDILGRAMRTMGMGMIMITSIA